MNNIKFTKKECSAFLLLLIFFFSKAFLIVPVVSLGIKTDFPLTYTYSPESISTWILLILFSFAASFFVLKLHTAYGVIASVTGLFILTEPFFASSLNTPVKLFVSLSCLICIYLRIFQSNISVSGISLCIFMLISGLLLPSSVFSTGLICIILFAVCSNKNKKSVAFIASGCIFAALGIALNKLLNLSSDVFSAFSEQFAIKDKFQEIKSIENLPAFLPFVVISCIFINSYIKTSKKINKNSKLNQHMASFIYNILSFSYLIAVISYIFFDSGAFFTINIIVLVIILGLIIIKDEACLLIAEKVTTLTKQYPLYTALILMLIYYLAFKYTDNFYSAEKFIKFIRY